MSNTGIKNFTSVLAWGALCFATLAPAGAQTPPAVAKAPACEIKTTRADHMIYNCPIVATEAAQRFRFVANFGGSHDDTKLSLRATLDGAPAECTPGSKPSSRFEDGDIRLDCGLELKGAAGTRHVWAVRVQWYHAQLFDVRFTAE